MAVTQSSYVKSITGSVSNTATSLVQFGFLANDVAVADRLFITVTAGALRITWDHPTGQNPAGSTGLKVPTSNWPPLEFIGRANMPTLQFFGDGGSSCTFCCVLVSD